MALERYEEIKAKGETPSERVFRDLMDSFYSKAMASSSSFSAAPVPESAFITEEERLETTELLQKRHNALFRLYLIFQEMKINGVRPDAAVYNTLINACAGAGDLEKALETVAAMQVLF